MLELIVLSKALNLYAHAAHNNSSRAVFLQDHDFFGDLYSQADGIYDSLVERHIGNTDQDIDLNLVLSQVSEKLKALPCVNVKENKIYYIEILKLIQAFNTKAAEIAPKLSLGSNNLIAGHADALEVIIYKIKRRIK